MRWGWRRGNAARLLENGEAFYPAVFAAIAAARHEVVLETFILFEDRVGMELHAVLAAAARRGVHVDVLVDGFGCADLTPAFRDSLAQAGVRLRVFDPSPRWLGIRFGLLRRMHRKLVVVDGHTAFVGGINYSADHLADYGPEAKQDYAVELGGPVVADIRRYALRQSGQRGRARRPLPGPEQRAGPVEALFVVRDNLDNRTAIERQYRLALRTAERRAWIANAYFFPGWRLLREMRRAARRGVDVRLILQGEPDMPIVKTAASLLYDHLLRDGVRIHEYCERPLHGKVALVDDDWATVGSSNLDPLSLSLNLEANVVLRDTGFARELAARLEALMRGCREVTPPAGGKPGWWDQLRSTVVFHVLRRFPRWATRLPAHEPVMKENDAR